MGWVGFSYTLMSHWNQPMTTPKFLNIFHMGIFHLNYKLNSSPTIRNEMQTLAFPVPPKEALTIERFHPDYWFRQPIS